MKFGLFIGFFLGILPFSKAQEAKPTDWTVRFSRTDFKAMDTVTLIFEGLIPEKQAVYATNMDCDAGPLPSLLLFTGEQAGYRLVDSARSVGEHSEYDDVFECWLSKFTHKAEIRQVIRPMQDGAVINGILVYQTCTHNMCVQFKLSFEISGNKIVKVAHQP